MLSVEALETEKFPNSGKKLDRLIISELLASKRINKVAEVAFLKKKSTLKK